MIVGNLAFGDYTDYLTVPAGTYEIALYAAGTKDSPVLFDTLTVNKDSMSTVAAVGNISSVGGMFFICLNFKVEKVH